MDMATPTVDKFLAEVARLMREKNGIQIQNFLHYEPPWPPLYSQMISELRQTYPVFQQNKLEQKCSKALPAEEEGDGGGSFTSFISFLFKYFAFIRDVDVSQLLETHDMLKGLLGFVKVSRTFLWSAKLYIAKPVSYSAHQQD